MTTRLTDGELEILDDLERDADPGPEPECPTCGGDSIACPDCKPIAPAPLGLPAADPDGDTYNPESDEADDDALDPIAVAWWAGYSAARDDFEAERRDLEMTVARLEVQIADYRAELAHRDR